MSGLATYYFVPAVRRGLAGAIAQDADGERATLSVRLHASASGSSDDTDRIDTSVQLYGPGDILGFDSRIVVRTDPRANVGDFEPNYFPMIEFADADFLWRFTAASGDATGLTPWVTLIVLEETEFDETGYKQNTGSATDPEVPWIKVLDATTLPNLGEAWRWAHVHVTDDSGITFDDATFTARDAAAPEQVVSRLLCARRLKPSTAYDAFVVPTFKLGCVAAGRAAPANDDTAVTLAWDNAAGGEVQLPYYYRWRFITAERGDFEYLVRLLVPRQLATLGVRPMDCSAAGYGMPPAGLPAPAPSTPHVLDLEGALKSIGVEYTPWGKDDPPGDPATPFQRRLASDLLNKPHDDLFGPRSITIATADTDVVQNVTVTCTPVTTAIGGVVGSMVNTKVEWTTTVPASCSVEFDPSVTLTSPSGTQHEVSFGALERGSSYRFRVSATDAAGDTSTTAPLLFDTPAFPLPAVVPPIYGRWHAGRMTVTPDGLTWAQTTDGSWARTAGYPWIDELNLDPRHRAAAGFGSLVIEQQQEALMASVWDQLGQIDDANEILCRAQLGREAADAIFERLTELSRGDFLRTTEAVHRRIRIGASTVHRTLVRSPIPSGALDPAFRRVQRTRGLIRKRQGVSAADGRRDVLERLNDRSLRPAGPAKVPDGTVGVCDITTSMPPMQPPQPPSGGTGRIVGTVTSQAGPLAGAVVRVVGTTLTAQTNQQGAYTLENIPAGTQTLSFSRLEYSAKQVAGVLVIGGQTTTVNALLTPGVTVPVEPPDDGTGVTGISGGGAGSVVAGTGAGIVGTGGSLTSPGTGLATVGGTGAGVTVPGPVVVVGPGPATPIAPEERFCEEFITSDAVQDAVGPRRAQTMQGYALPPGVTVEQVRDALCGALDYWLTPAPPRDEPPAAVDLQGIVNVLQQALAPRITIAERTTKRLTLDDVAPRSDPLEPVMASPEFPQPMYEPLRDISQDLVLPGIERVPPNTLALVETNGRFVESYMVALNHALTGEMLWRETPVSGRATYFRQFWDVSDYVPAPGELDQLLDTFLANKGVTSVADLPVAERNQVFRRHRKETGDISALDSEALDALLETLLKEGLLAEKLKDIKRLHQWGISPLGSNDNRAPGTGEQLVLLVRGDLLRKYPNTLVYAIPAIGAEESRDPGLPEFMSENGTTPPERIFPVFSGTLPPDLYFFGFPFAEHDARGVPNDAGQDPKYDLGVYFVLEERVSEARFGIDEGPPPGGISNRPGGRVADWDNLTWDHFGHVLKADLTYASPVVPGEYLDAIVPRPVESTLTPMWDSSSASIAWITVQKPVRIAVHADQLLPTPPPE